MKYTLTILLSACLLWSTAQQATTSNNKPVTDNRPHPAEPTPKKVDKKPGLVLNVKAPAKQEPKAAVKK